MKRSAMFKKFLRNESGATAIEYGLIAVVIAVVVIGAVNWIGTSLKNAFGHASPPAAASSSR